MLVLKIDTRRIVDAGSFHDVMQETFFLPATYGRNLDALIDCLSDLDQPSTRMTGVSVATGQVLTLVLQHAESFSQKHPALWEQLLDVTAFVNWRRTENKQPPVLALAYHRH